MSAEEIKQREAYFKDFGDILVRRHGQNYYSSYHNDSRITVDDVAERFGRYLRAARVNMDLLPAELAKQVSLSEATLTALEQGLILACDIKPNWLKTLAKALDEDYKDFNLILGCQISSGNPQWFTKRLINQWQNWFIHSKIFIVSRPIYVACSAILIFFVTGAISLLGFNNSQAHIPPGETYSFTNVKPERRLNMIKAELRLESQILLFSASLGSISCCIY